MLGFSGWHFLAAAILFEVAGTTAMKFSDGLTKLWPSLLLFGFYGCSFLFLTLALKRIELGVAYAIWSGLGTALIAVIGVLAFQESMSWPKFASLVLIVVGVVSLNLSD